MTEPSTTHSSSPNENRQQTDPENGDRDPEPTFDVRDLVYSGGYDRDPQEILGNPGVAPQMIQEGRDLRVDLYQDAEEADPNLEE